jgi:hypothetical protein
MEKIDMKKPEIGSKVWLRTPDHKVLKARIENVGEKRVLLNIYDLDRSGLDISQNRLVDNRYKPGGFWLKGDQTL